MKLDRQEDPTQQREGGACHDPSWRAAVESSPMAMALHEMIFDAAGHPIDYVFLATNAAFDQHTGLQGHEIIGRKVTDALPGIRQTPFIGIYGDVVRTQTAHVFQQYSEPLRRTYSVHAYPVQGHQFVTLFQDITEQVLAEAERKAADDLLHGVFESIQDGISILNPDLTIRQANRTLQAWFAVNAPIEGKMCYQAYHNAEAPCDPCPSLRCMRTGKVETEIVGTVPGSPAEWLELFCYPMKDPSSGEVTGVVEFVRDVTERLRSEQALQRERRQLQEAQAIARVGSWEYDALRDRLVWSDETHRIFGTTPGSFEETYEAFLAHVHPEDRSAVEALYAQSLDDPGVTYQIEHRIIRSDTGEDRHVFEKCRHERDSHGQVIRSIGVVHDITELRQTQEELQVSYERVRASLDGAVLALSRLAEMRDPYTIGHQRRVADLAVQIGEAMGLAQDRIRAVHVAGTLHDAGKASIPSEILSKPGRLSPLERNIVEAHAERSHEIVKDIPFGQPVAEIVLQHHERLDGSGYPRGLRGKEIMIEARIMAVADTVDAMASHRPYRPALGLEAALEEIQAGRGVRYDPEVVDLCVQLFADGYRLDDDAQTAA